MNLEDYVILTLKKVYQKDGYLINNEPYVDLYLNLTWGGCGYNPVPNRRILIKGDC